VSGPLGSGRPTGRPAASLGAPSGVSTRAPLLAVAHGTRDPIALAALEAILDRVRVLRPGLETALAFTSIGLPSPERAVAELAGGGAREVVVLPLLLGSGHHARHDILRAVWGGRNLAGLDRLKLHQSAALGPDPALAAVLADRLAAVGGTAAGTQVVLAAAGSTDPRANADAVAMAGLLAEHIGRPVRTAFIGAAAAPSLAELLPRLARRGRPVAVAPYLLAPGEFHRRMRDCAALVGLEATFDPAAQPSRIRPLVVADPLGAHELVARLILRRYTAALPR
jgi:sirohydrochlorin ferrochelatase